MFKYILDSSTLAPTGEYILDSSTLAPTGEYILDSSFLTIYYFSIFIVLHKILGRNTETSSNHIWP